MQNEYLTGSIGESPPAEHKNRHDNQCSVTRSEWHRSFKWQFAERWTVFETCSNNHHHSQ